MKVEQSRGDFLLKAYYRYLFSHSFQLLINIIHKKNGKFVSMIINIQCELIFPLLNSPLLILIQNNEGTLCTSMYKFLQKKYDFKPSQVLGKSFSSMCVAVEFSRGWERVQNYKKKNVQYYTVKVSY